MINSTVFRLTLHGLRNDTYYQKIMPRKFFRKIFRRRRTGVIVEEHDNTPQKWSLAAMEKYMRNESDPSVALGLVPRRSDNKHVMPGDHQLESAGEESSPSWASSSAGNTPSYGSGGMAFEFGPKVSADDAQQTTGTPTITTTRCTPTSTPGRGRSSEREHWSPSSGSLSSDLLTALESDVPKPDKRQMRKGSVDSIRNASNGGSHTGTPSRCSKLSRLLRRTHSAGGTKDVSSHSLSMKEKAPVTKTKSADAAPCSREDGDEKQKRNRKTLAQDMKMRLSFLRRRHTDSSLQSSVRPTPEEAQKWAQSFQELTSSKYGLSLFRAFLSREFSDENIEFWLACEDFKRCRPNKMSSKAKKIYEDFIALQSPREVNLDSATRATIFKILPNPDRHSFDTAQRKIQGIMEQDAYLRFLQSELYMDLIDCEQNTR